MASKPTKPKWLGNATASWADYDTFNREKAVARMRDLAASPEERAKIQDRNSIFKRFHVKP